MANRMLAASSNTGHTCQSLEDKLHALKYIISGQGISFVTLKATTSELIGPKRKHLVYLLTMSNQPNVSIPSMAKHLVRRARHPDWPVAFKSLITMHHLITYGHENFLQNLASSSVNSTAIDKLGSFVDQTTTRAYNMSIFLRRYARYLSTKIQSYRILGEDYCRARANIRMRHLTLEQLLQTLPIIQEQFDALLAFDASIEDLSNGIINSAFIMLYKDFIKLYIVYQAAVIRLLELFFASDNHKEAKELFNLYKRFLVRMDKVSDFMPVIDSVGLDKSNMPKLSRVPEAPLSLLERHLNQLELPNRRNYDHSLGRIEYGTLGRPRRRSIKTPTRQPSIDILSPMAVKNYRKRSEELKRLDKMIGLESDRGGDFSNGLLVRDVIEESGDEAKSFLHEYAEMDGAQSASKAKPNGSTSDNATESGQEIDLITLPSPDADSCATLDKASARLDESGSRGVQNDPDSPRSVFDAYANDDMDSLTSWVKA